MESKCLKFSEGLGINYLKSSPHFILDMLKRNNKVGINLHGEGNDMTDEKRYIIVSELRKYFHAMITELDTPLECIYNADQTNH